MGIDQNAGILALYAVVELVKFFVRRMNRPVMGMTPDESRQLDDLHKWHDKTDDDGRRLWYNPKNLYTSLEKQTDMVRDIATTQRDIAQILERILLKLDEK